VFRLPTLLFAVCRGCLQLPEYVAYHEIVTSKRQFMRGVTVVDPARLLTLTQGSPLCRGGEPLATPLPFYDAATDSVMCYVSPTYGDKAWQLPAQPVPVPSLEQRCRVFARSLLEGSVFPGMKSQKYASSPSMLTHQVPQRRCAVLVGALANARPPVDNKASLIDKLRTDKHYLRDALLMWAVKGSEGDLKRVWDACVGKETS
jgi:ATP-dependent RNA helicase DHX37/DHR1